MTPERWQQVKRVLEQVLPLEASQRRGQLEALCGADRELRREVETLLEADAQAGSRFLNQPAADIQLAPPCEAAALRVGRRIGAYTILEEIGRGGMGEVYRASRTDGEFKQQVAIKVVRGGYDTSSIVERFRNERQILAGLDHANIARLFDGGTTDDGVPYLVMELVDGEAIHAYCDAHRLDVTQRVALFRRVCAAVAYAHQRLVIHRDLKPGNIMVSKEGVPKLLDFGVAKILDPALSAEATLARPMTPEYASPEQVRGEAITTASDVYSLGVVLYQLLTGRSPYRVRTRTPHELAKAITEVEPERPSAAVMRREGTENGGAPRPAADATLGRLHKRLRGDLDHILLKALRKEPALRYASVEQLDEDLRHHLEGLPVTARKGTWSYRSGKFIRRHRTAAAAAAMVFVTLIAGVVVTLREARIAEANRRRAEARFNDVRKLANSLIFEIHDSIRDLPGATQARKLILQRSLEYLDSLAKESGNDPELLRELAKAYGRIGEFQGSPEDPNLGDTKGALTSFLKCLQMQEALVRANPQSMADRIELATADLNYSDFQRAAAGNVVAGFDYAKKAVEILDREIISAPRDFRVVAQSTRAYTNLGMMQVGEGAMGSVGTVSGGVADLQKALALDRRLLEIAPSFANGRGQIAVINIVLGDAMEKLGDRPQALTYYQHALDALQTANLTKTNIRAAANWTITTGKMADVFLVEGDTGKAFSLYSEAEKKAEELAVADPHNEMLQRNLIVNYAQLGHVLAETGDTEKSLDWLRKAHNLLEAEPAHTPLIQTFKGILEAWVGEALERGGKVGEAVPHYAKCKQILGAVRAGNRSDRRMQMYYASALVRLGGAFLKLGKSDDARAEFDESLAMLEPLYGANTSDQEVRYALAETYTCEGRTCRALAERSRLPADKLRHWKQARGWFAKSLNTWSGVANPARISTSGVEVTLPSEVSSHLNHCDSQIAALRQFDQPIHRP